MKKLSNTITLLLILSIFLISCSGTEKSKIQLLEESNQMQQEAKSLLIERAFLLEAIAEKVEQSNLLKDSAILLLTATDLLFDEAINLKLKNKITESAKKEAEAYIKKAEAKPFKSRYIQLDLEWKALLIKAEQLKSDALKKHSKADSLYNEYEKK